MLPLEKNSKSCDVYALESGCRAVVTAVLAQSTIRQRLFDMGFVPDCEFVKQRTALGGDPVWVCLDGVQIALRKKEAQAIMVERVS